MTDTTPFATPPAVKTAAGLSNTHEYGAIWTGQSNARPTGYPSSAFQYAFELSQQADGLDLTAIVIPNNADRKVGQVERVACDSTVVTGTWNNGTWLRLGTPTAPLAGYAQVIGSHASGLDVKWVSLPDNGDGVSTSSGYLNREGGEFRQYEHVRTLTTYRPLNDPTPPYEEAPQTSWTVPVNAPYPTANAALRSGGRSLILPTGWTVPSAVTTFADLGLFLKLTRREGAAGFGISEICDSTWNGLTKDPPGPVGQPGPIPHPITDVTGDVFTFLNGITSTGTNDRLLDGGYVLVDWEAAGVSKRSWNKVASSTTTTFTVESGAWDGDGAPASPVDDANVTFTLAAPGVVNWAAHPFAEGDRVCFYGGTTLPTTPSAQVNEGQTYYVRNPGAGTFEISESMEHPVLEFTSVGVGGPFNGEQVWVYAVWLPHWTDNPNTWKPGPEFAYPNEDHQPHTPYVHFKARGQLLYGHHVAWAAGGGSTLTPFDGVSDARFGSLLPWAWNIGAAIGKRINVVALGLAGAPLQPSNLLNTTGHQGVIGWWNPKRYAFAVPNEASAETSLTERLARLITFIAPQALLAESNTKTLRYLAAAHLQGETDALIDNSRQLFAGAIADYRRWIRDQVDSVSLSPYADGAEMPFVMPQITRDPWEFDGSTTTFQAFGLDFNGEVNNAIREQMTAEEFSGYVLVDDLPKLIYVNGNTDAGHYSGQGQALLGARLATVTLELLEHAFNYGSTALASATSSRLLYIVNQAMQHIGQNATEITSLDQNIRPAKIIKSKWAEAVCFLLSQRQWSWAMRDEDATEVIHRNPHWQYAYVVPKRALSVIAIEAYQAATDTRRLVATYAPTVRNDLQQVKPDNYEMGRSPSGHRILFTNVPQEDGDITNRAIVGTVGGADLNPERLPKRPTIRYIEKSLDPDRFSDSFVEALALYLGSKIAPALIGGQQGAEVARQLSAQAGQAMRQEAAHETANQQIPLDHRAPWIDAR